MAIRSNRKPISANGQPYMYFKNGSSSNAGQRLSGDGATAYSYDANGSMLTKNGPGGGYSFDWDYLNRRRGVAGATTASYAYDYQGRRSKKTIGSVTTTYLFSGAEVLRDSGSITTDYLLGVGIDEPLACVTGGNVFYLDVDALGSVTASNKVDGVVQHAVMFDAWGSVKSEIGTRVQPLAYSGREVGEGDSLFYRARYLFPSVGRFGGEDPLGNPGVSRYAYASNNPIRLRDPFGLEGEEPVLGPPPIIPIVNPIITGPLFPFFPSPYGGGESYFHGNYGGPGWSGGSWAPGGGENPPWAGAPPKDPEDGCYAAHDRCYSNCRQHPGCPRGQCLCTRRCDLAVASCLRSIDGGGIRISATAAFFDFSGNVPCWQ